MLNRDEAQTHSGLMVIHARYDEVSIDGTARCDHVAGSTGKMKLRAKFGHGVKAILDFDDYGAHWTAEAAADDREQPEKRADVSE